ncbi:MAG: DUF2779 domain-containing protein, partial [Betaproteobacteria bacterium]|nr:DUF2779 domain-containing protein [Betaproteobacteria bacterium]
MNHLESTRVMAKAISHGAPTLEPSPMRLSKSRLVAWLQCPKRLWLQQHHPEFAAPSEAAANRMAQGHKVGAAAQTLFPGGHLVGHVDNLSAALRETEALLAKPGDVTVFEAALKASDILVRADVLVRENGACRLIEVKSSTKVKDYQVTDAGIQTWVARAAGLDRRRHRARPRQQPVRLSRRTGLPRSPRPRRRLGGGRPHPGPSPAWIADAKRDLAGPVPAVDVGPQCTDPFECEFRGHCAPVDAEYPVTILPHGGKFARQLHDEGYTDLRDVPEERLTKSDHLRVWRASRSGEAELSPDAAGKLAALPWPRYFLDFETVGPAVPLWPGTRPYQKIPMQWSCHRQEADGNLVQLPPFLATGDGDPRRPFAAALVAAIGGDGPILVYNAVFERGVILELAAAFPDLASRLQALADRLFDLLPFTREHYYHPAMMGSWSIKAVLPTIAPDLDYANLDDVQSGEMVEPVYFEMIDPA